MKEHSDRSIIAKLFNTLKLIKMYAFENSSIENIYGGCIVTDIVDIDTDRKVDTVYQRQSDLNDIWTHTGKKLSFYNLDYDNESHWN